MTKSTALVAAILRMMGTDETPALRHRAEDVAPFIERASRITGVDPYLIAAVAMKESSFRSKVEGEAGEVGVMQIKPGRFARKMCQDFDLSSPAQNVLCGARYLLRAQRICGGAPAHFLRLYNGQMCGRSEYADHVLRILRRALSELALR